jgi:hypothetical protein
MVEVLEVDKNRVVCIDCSHIIYVPEINGYYSKCDIKRTFETWDPVNGKKVIEDYIFYCKNVNFLNDCKDFEEKQDEPKNRQTEQEKTWYEKIKDYFNRYWG